MDKISRICWNTNNWKRPSGSEGKSRVASSYENSVGFGHEEWLLDDSRVLPDGYHYGFYNPSTYLAENISDKSTIFIYLL